MNGLDTKRIQKAFIMSIQIFTCFITGKHSNSLCNNVFLFETRNIHTKFEANPCSGLREEVEKLKKFTPTTTMTTTTTDTA